LVVYNERLHWLIVPPVAIRFVTANLLAPANQADNIHSTVMWALLWLIGLHVVAALYHHLVRRDGTLARHSGAPSQGRTEGSAYRCRD
jgi:cytochrome b561